MPSVKKVRGELLLRQACLEDEAALRRVLFDTFESTWRPNLTSRAIQAFIEEDRPVSYIRSRGLQFWVAELDAGVVGFVDWEGDFVNALHVLQTQARKGVGSLLMDFAEGRIAKVGHVSSRLETDTFNAQSQAFYASRGYREIGRYPDTEWDSGLTTILLEKPLPRQT